MKALTDVVTFDRMSTREELKQVLDLLSDVDSTRNIAILDLPETDGSSEIDSREELWAEMVESDQAQEAELGTLTNLFLGRHERTN